MTISEVVDLETKKVRKWLTSHTGKPSRSDRSKKMTLQEVQKWISDHEDIEVGIQVPSIDQLMFDRNGRVKVASYADTGIAMDLKDEELPFEFAPALHCPFIITGMKSFKGFPKRVVNSQSGIYSKKELPFDGIMEDVDGITFDIPSLKGIHEHLKRAKNIMLSPHVTKNVLGLLMIDGLKSFYDVNSFIGDDSDVAMNRISKVLDILSTHLKNPDKHKRVIAAQRELIENDLDDYAEM